MVDLRTTTLEPLNVTLSDEDEVKNQNAKIYASLTPGQTELIYYMEWAYTCIRNVNTFFVAVIAIFIAGGVIRNKNFMRSCFFVIFLFGDVHYVVGEIFEILADTFNINFFFKMCSFFSWHLRSFIGIWNLILAFNRFTAVLFWQKMSVFWNAKTTTLSILFLVVYPFLMNIPIFKFWPCYWGFVSTRCYVANWYYNFALIVSTLTASFIAVGFCLSASLSSRFCHNSKIRKNVSTKQRSAENVLLVQTLFLTFFFTTVSVFRLLAFLLDYYFAKLFFLQSMLISETLFITVLYVPFLLSRQWRRQLFEFYRLPRFMIPRHSPQKTKATAVTVFIAQSTY